MIKEEYHPIRNPTIKLETSTLKIELDTRALRAILLITDFFTGQTQVRATFFNFRYEQHEAATRALLDAGASTTCQDKKSRPSLSFYPPLFLPLFLSLPLSLSDPPKAPIGPWAWSYCRVLGGCGFL